MQYQDRIDALLNGRCKDDLAEPEKEIYNSLYKASLLDPRLPDIMFGTSVEALIGSKIASKLDSMSNEEFSASPFVYEWLDQFKSKSIYKITNNEKIKSGKTLGRRETEKQILDYVYGIVSMASHFEGELADNSKYFDIDFDINSQDDKIMAEEMKVNGLVYAKKLLEENEYYPDCGYDELIILLGEQCMLGAYILTKLYSNNSSKKLMNRLIKYTSNVYLKDEKMDLIIAGGIADLIASAREFFQDCIRYGEKVATSL